MKHNTSITVQNIENSITKHKQKTQNIYYKVYNNNIYMTHNIVKI